MQTAGPGQYFGKRVRLLAFVKAEVVSQWAGVWMRVDGPQDRPIKGTIDWTRVEIVLDVPNDAKDNAFGILGSAIDTRYACRVSFKSVNRLVQF